MYLSFIASLSVCPIRLQVKISWFRKCTVFIFFGFKDKGLWHKRLHLAVKYPISVALSLQWGKTHHYLKMLLRLLFSECSLKADHKQMKRVQMNHCCEQRLVNQSWVLFELFYYFSTAKGNKSLILVLTILVFHLCEIIWGMGQSFDPGPSALRGKLMVMA